MVATNLWLTVNLKIMQTALSMMTNYCLTSSMVVPITANTSWQEPRLLKRQKTRLNLSRKNSKKHNLRCLDEVPRYLSS